MTPLRQCDSNSSNAYLHQIIFILSEAPMLSFQPVQESTDTILTNSKMMSWWWEG
jgi:hypothetical protein